MPPVNRRQFLTRALAAVPVVLAGEELLELLAPRKTIFLPPRIAWINYYRRDLPAFVRDFGADFASGPDVTVVTTWRKVWVDNRYIDDGDRFVHSRTVTYAGI